MPKTDDVSGASETWEWNTGIITLIKQQRKVRDCL